MRSFHHSSRLGRYLRRSRIKCLRNAALQLFYLPRKRQYSLGELIGIATVAAIDDAGVEESWKTNHNSADEKKENVFHSDQVALKLCCIVERFPFRDLRYFCNFLTYSNLGESAHC